MPPRRRRGRASYSPIRTTSTNSPLPTNSHFSYGCAKRPNRWRPNSTSRAEPRRWECHRGRFSSAASLIEREAKVDGDRAKIARVIYNRLQRDMKLEIDATVLLRGQQRQRCAVLQRSHRRQPVQYLQIKGLPPTPIATPSKKSLEAALAPADGKWLWYVLTDPSRSAHLRRN